MPAATTALPCRRLSVAPMMAWTDRHQRSFLRLIAREALLYTEMVTTGAVLHGDRNRFLAFDPAERPLALQLGGSDPDDLAAAAGIGASYGYDEINLNCGCPSPRVRRGRFGASLMAEPGLVRECVAAMREASDRSVTVKCRIGVDERDGFADLLGFVDAVAEGGCSVFVVHARKAWLEGLSPKENREVPPLRRDVVRRLKAERPHLTVVVNGGLSGPDEAAAELRAGLDGVMIGRSAYHEPFGMAAIEAALFPGGDPAPDRWGVVRAYLPYLERRTAEGVPLRAMTRHMLGLFNGLPGARRWRRALTEGAARPDARPSLVLDAAPAAAERPALAA